MIAWKLTTDFNEQRHLFFEKIKTDYIVEAYICSCGHTDFIIKHPKQELKYICNECANIQFYDAKSAWDNIGHFLYKNLDLEFSYDFDIKTDEGTVSSRYLLDIPAEIDFSSRKILYSKKTLHSLTLARDGELSKNYSLKINQDISLKLKDNLTNYINKNSYFDIPSPQDKELNLTMVSYFLKNKHLQDFDFYYWADINILPTKNININDALNYISSYPKTKTVKKAVYQNYLNQLTDNKNFNSTFVEVFCKIIEDINILTNFLKLQLDYSMYRDISKAELTEILVFLKLHYTEKQLLKLFSSKEFNSKHIIFKDAIGEFQFSKSVIENTFKKVTCKIQSIHDEFVRCSQEERYKHIYDKKIMYSKEDIRACVNTSNYEVRLPTSGQELYEWADALHNCMAGYFDLIRLERTIIYCFFLENILSFAVEINDGRIAQASGKYNAELSIEENKVLTKWYKLFSKNHTQVIANVA